MTRLRRATKGVQGHGPLYSAGRRIRRPRKVHHHRRASGPPRGNREGVLILLLGLIATIPNLRTCGSSQRALPRVVIMRYPGGEIAREGPPPPPRLPPRDSRCAPRLPWSRASPSASSRPPETGWPAPSPARGRFASVPGAAENVARTSLITCAFSSFAARAAGKNSRSSPQRDGDHLGAVHRPADRARRSPPPADSGPRSC